MLNSLVRDDTTGELNTAAVNKDLRHQPSVKLTELPIKSLQFARLPRQQRHETHRDSIVALEFIFGFG